MAGNDQKSDFNESDGSSDFAIVVIGASAGGVDAIKELVSKLPNDLNAAIFIVWHMSPTIEGVLPNVLNRLNSLPASNAIDKEPITPGRIYVAPPDKHLLVEKGIVRVTKGPKENRFRPAVDPLFRSAAFNYGHRVIGIILSGSLDDGTSGLWTIKHFGGTAVVQDPDDAEVRGMPESALREVEVDHCLPIAGIAALLINRKTRKKILNDEFVEKDNKTEAEIRIASEDNAFALDIMQYGELSPFTCPECHGVLSSFRDGNIKRYRCHTGHAFSADSLLSSITERIEESLYAAIRGMDEATMLLNHVGDHFAEKNETKLASYYFNKAKQSAERSSMVRVAVFGNQQLSEQQLKDEIHEDKKKEDNP